MRIFSYRNKRALRRALLIEREQIRIAFDNELISRETVRSMRDNVSAIEFGLQQ